MKIARKLKQRAGFTLVELCVVMAVAAIVGTMVMTSVIFFNKQQTEITREAKTITETTMVQNAVNTWLKKYDSSSFTIALSNSQLVASNSSGNVGTLSFANHKIMDGTNAATEDLEYIQSVSFNRPSYTKDSTSIPDRVVNVTITYTNDTQQKLLFSLFSAVTRERKVEGRG